MPDLIQARDKLGILLHLELKQVHEFNDAIGPCLRFHELEAKEAVEAGLRLEPSMRLEA